MDVSALAQRLRKVAGRKARFMVAIAGPPGAGKSTLSGKLKDALGAEAIVVPMDGFHFDDQVLNARGHRSRKGAPHTFDVAGFEVLLKRIKAREPNIAIPVFDRSLELSKAGADIVSADARFILVEGNYLLLKQKGWKNLKRLFNCTIMLKVPEAEIQRRLTARIISYGFDEAHARNWIASNDMPNVHTVLNESAKADLDISN
jgi:pantothenate kinase